MYVVLGNMRKGQENWFMYTCRDCCKLCIHTEMLRFEKGYWCCYCMKYKYNCKSYEQCVFCSLRGERV